MVRTFLMLAVLLVGCTIFAQTPEKSGKSKEPAKAKTDDTPKEAVKPKITLDKLKPPPGTVLVVVDELAKALELVPNQILMTPEEYQKLLDRIRTLEKQLKSEKKLPHSCVLHAKQDGDLLAVKAAFTFSTDQPNTPVYLGLPGALVMDLGKLDKGVPNLDANKEGLTVKVEKEGNHTLTLNLRLRLKAVKSTPWGTEYSFPLILPGAAVQTLELDLPVAVKKLRSNDLTLDAPTTPGKWKLGLDAGDAHRLSWTQPVALSEEAPLSRVEGQIKAAVDTTEVKITADLFLEALRMPSKEWRLQLPPQAVIEDVKPPPGLTCQKIPPDAKKPYHTLVLSEATSEKWQATVGLRLPRPNPGARLPIGPFAVLGAYQQFGTITVHMPVEMALGQRLVYHRLGDTYQLKNTENEAVFQYGSPVAPDKLPKTPLPLRTPLELEWRNEKNQLATSVEHTLKLKMLKQKQGWDVETTSVIEVKALFSVINAVDLKLPPPRSREAVLLASTMPGMALAAALPWNGAWNPFGTPVLDIASEEYVVTDDLGNHLKLVPLDAFGKTRVLLERSPGKKMTLKLKNTYRLPVQQTRLRLDLPRPLNSQDGGARITIQSDDNVELRYGPAGAEEPVPEKHHFEWHADSSPAQIDFAWRPYRREVIAEAEVDILVHGHSAEVRQSVRFPPPDPAAHPAADAKHQLIVFHLPRELDKVKVEGGEVVEQNRNEQKLWIKRPAGSTEKIDFVYDVALPKNPAVQEGAASVTLPVPLLWPEHVSRKEAKVRLWAQTGGMSIHLTDDLVRRGLWKERLEAVDGKDTFPALVLVGSAAQLPLALRIDHATTTPLAAFLADRGLIQIVMNDDGSQHCRARFLVRKLNAHHLDVELPLAKSLFPVPPAFRLGQHPLTNWKSIDADEKIIRLKLHPELIKLPEILEISYTIPPAALERSSSWRTTMHAPRFPSGAVLGQLRWQLSLPAPMIATALNRQMRAGVQWGLQGWLPTPEPAVTSASLDGWLTGKDGVAGPPLTYAFAAAGLQQAPVVYHLPRNGWLLGCSGLLLILVLAVYLSPLPRLVFWLFLLVLATGVLVLGMVWPALLPPLFFGMQPGVLLLLVFVAAHWYLQERYRRQLVFLPAFARSKPNSTMTRSSSQHRPREASTVDAPAGGVAPSGARSSPSGT